MHSGFPKYTIMRWVDYLVLLLGGSMVKMSNLFSIVASFLCRVDFVDF